MALTDIAEKFWASGKECLKTTVTRVSERPGLLPANPLLAEEDASLPYEILELFLFHKIAFQLI